LDTAEDLQAFPDHVLPLLKRLVPHDVGTYNEVQPQAGRIRTVYTPAGALPADGERLFGPLIAQHPVIQHVQQTGDGRACKLSDFLSQRQFHQLGLYQDFFRLAGLEHQIALMLPAPRPLVVGIALNRTRGDFSERDRLLLDLMRPHLVQAYRHAAARTRIGAALAALERALDADERGVVLLSRGGGRPLLTAQARRWLAAYWGPPLRRSSVLPAVVEGWLQGQRARLAGDAAPAPAEPLVVERGDRRLHLRFLRGSGAGGPDVLLLHEDARPVVDTLPAEGPLTPRECTVLEQLGRV